MQNKKIVIFVSILALAFVFTACTKISALKELVGDRKQVEIIGIEGKDDKGFIEEKNTQTETSDNSITDDKENDTVNLQEHEVPKGFTEGYIFGEYEKYNSAANENGYGGDKIWVKGTIKEVSVMGGDTLFCILYTDEGEGWLIGLDYTEVDKKIYDDLIGHSVIAKGIYQGFSEVYIYPAIFMNMIWDSTDGSIITSVLWGDYEGEDWNDSFVEWKEGSFRNISFQIPVEWGEANYSDDGKYMYYYPDGGMLMLFVQEGSGFVFDNNDAINSFLDSFIEAMKDGYTDFCEESRTLKTLKNGKRVAVFDWSGYNTVVGMNMYTRAFFIEIDGNMLNISYNNYYEVNEENLELFEEIVNSIN